MIKRWLNRNRRPPEGLITLRNGEPVTLQPITAEDSWRLQGGLALMSSRSIYRRFFRSITRFSESELRYLTSADQVNHYATGAIPLESPDHPGYGVGRFVRDRHKRNEAEVALVVLDGWQGMGLGASLLRHLGRQAGRRGIDRFVGDILRENQPAANLFKALGAMVWPADDLTLRFALPVRNLR